MPNNAQVDFDAGTLPEGFCPSTEQERFNEYINRLTGSLPDSYSTVNVGNIKPAAIDQNKPWLRTNVDGTIDGWYTFANGIWRRPHTDFVGKTVLYTGSIANIATFDGGSVGTVTETTGPFWEEVTAAIGRTIVHPDPSKTVIKFQPNAVTISGAGSTGGEERHDLTNTEIPDHAHTVVGGTSIFQVGTGAQAGNFYRQDLAGNFQTGDPTNAANNGQPHNNMQPYIAVYLIRRTARLYYVIT